MAAVITVRLTCQVTQSPGGTPVRGGVIPRPRSLMK
jgi:hypothetical protein